MTGIYKNQADGPFRASSTPLNSLSFRFVFLWPSVSTTPIHHLVNSIGQYHLTHMLIIQFKPVKYLQTYCTAIVVISLYYIIEAK